MKIKHFPISLTLVIVFSIASTHPAAAQTDDGSDPDFAAWSNDDDPGVDHVNEGELTFLVAYPSAVLHLHNDITISEQSLISGWLKIRQCYSNLDAIDKVEIVYNFNEMKNLEIISSTNIGRVFIEQNTLQLVQVGNKAGLCVQAETRNLYMDMYGGFLLVSGPYHRRFLDGYYPYHVSLNIEYPGDTINFVSTVPVSQAGFAIKEQPNNLLIETVFEGTLTIKTGFTTGHL